MVLPLGQHREQESDALHGGREFNLVSLAGQCRENGSTLDCLVALIAKITKAVEPVEPWVAPRPQRRLTKHEIDQLVDSRRAGTKIADLATDFKVHRSTVLANLKRRGLSGA